MKPNTVRKYISQLEDKRLIETLLTTVWTLDGTARNGTRLYMILPIDEAVNQHLERQLAGLPKKKYIRKRRREQNLALCGPVCGFEGWVGERHHESPRPALLGQREPGVDESGGSGQPRCEKTNFIFTQKEIGGKSKDKQKGKSRPCRACTDSAHNRNINQ